MILQALERTLVAGTQGCPGRLPQPDADCPQGDLTGWLGHWLVNRETVFAYAVLAEANG